MKKLELLFDKKKVFIEKKINIFTWLIHFSFYPESKTL